MHYLCSLVLVDAVEFKCPQKNGVYEDANQCDKFYQCTDGVATEKLCPDGLVFDPLNRKVNKCDQPFNVDCGNRLELRKWLRAIKLCTRLYRCPMCILDLINYYLNLEFSEEPKSNHLCPRRNGYFAHPDEKVCNIFYNCIEGEATEITCPTGLHFDEYSGTCVWPDSAHREGCGEPETSKADDFFPTQFLRRTWTVSCRNSEYLNYFSFEK